MIVQRMEWPTCETIGPRVHLSAGNWHDGYFWVQVSDGHNVFIAHLEAEEWADWLARLPAVTAGKRRAAVVAGQMEGGSDGT